VPGAILFVVLGLGPLFVAVLTWRRHRLAPLLACATGEALIIWLVVEIAIVGYSNRPPLQAFYLSLGGLIVLVGVHWLRRTRRPGEAYQTGL
jgi:high-affinity Fe2+/Pb2+ permease